MIASSLGAAHLTAAFVALTLGFVVLAARKGTAFHRLFGAGYVVAMVMVNATALGVYRLNGQFNPFHALALLSLATTIWGLVVALRQRPGWTASHLQLMSYSYLGLLAAATAEGVLRLGLLRHAISGASGIITIGVAIAIAFALAGAWLIPRMRMQNAALSNDTER